MTSGGKADSTHRADGNKGDRWGNRPCHLDFDQIKGQIKPKADLRAVDSPKKRTNKFVSFAYLLFPANKINSFVHFSGESTARKSAFGFI